MPAGKVGRAFWMFYERNDLIDLRDGNADPILMRSLEEGFSQNLQSRQQEIDAAAHGYLDERIANVRAERSLVFPALRAKLKEVMPLKAANDPHAEGGEGGKFVFVYLPSYRRSSGETLKPWANHKQAVIEAVQVVDAPLIDKEPRFLKAGDPLSRFHFRLNGHCNGGG